MIVIMVLQEWQEYTLAGIGVGVGKSLGFLPVYKTLEDARADFPTAPVQEIRLRQET